MLYFVHNSNKASSITKEISLGTDTQNFKHVLIQHKLSVVYLDSVVVLEYIYLRMLNYVFTLQKCQQTFRV